MDNIKYLISKEKQSLCDYNLDREYKKLSSLKLQQIDYDYLNSDLKSSKAFNRSLSLACSLDFNNMEFIVGKNIYSKLVTILSYSEDGIDYIIDYARDLIMKKDDYYEVYKFSEYSRLNKLELYNLYTLFVYNEDTDYETLLVWIIFYKEIFQELKNKYKELRTKFNRYGVNKNNYGIIGNECDMLFLSSEDYLNLKYFDDIDQVERFTLKPTNSNIDRFEDYYYYRGNISFRFKLLSSLFNDKKLNTLDRYGHCHLNSIMITHLHNNDKVYAVAGYIKRNDVNYMYHSWVEVYTTTEILVFDYSHNLIMNRDKYYELFGVKKINEIEKSDLEKILNYLKMFDFADSILIMYFGNELLKDLEKNKLIFERKL